MKDYNPPFILKNAHLQTIFPSVFRQIDFSFYTRERIETPDDDFLDLDWIKGNNKKLAIISHGLEGSSTRPYVTGMARVLSNKGWDILAWNFRSCSGSINRQLKFYHSGKTDDLETVIDHARKDNKYQETALIGFSMGGNLSLVYLGQQGSRVLNKISKCIVFSVPCDLKSSAEKLAEWNNKIYMWRFLHYLHEKIKKKMELFPGQIDDHDYQQVKNFKDFDDRYTAPIHGFRDAEDYWEKCSSRFFIRDIKIPALIINAQNDPFLTPACFPHKQCEENPVVTLEAPMEGGHVGFVEFNRSDIYWSERRAVAFLNS